MDNNRRAQVEQLIQNYLKIIAEYNTRIMLSLTPTERERFKFEQQQLEKMISRMEAELRGEVAVQDLPTLAEYQAVFNTSQTYITNIINQYVTKENPRACPTPLPPPAKFGGRDEILAEVKDQLRQGKFSAITAVDGLGGIGKTTLARQVAFDLFEDKTFRAVLWTEIRQNPVSLNLLLEWANRADAHFSPDSSLSLQQVAGLVRDKLQDLIVKTCQDCPPNRTLVVLDDVWDDGIETASLLQSAAPPNATFLITTRFQKVVTDLAAEKKTLPKLRGEQGVAMLLEYLPQNNRELLAQLVAALDGHTLALKLAAQRVLDYGGSDDELKRQIAEYEQGLPQGIDFDTLELNRGTPKDDNLTLALYLSYQRLDDTEKARFRALGLTAYRQALDTAMLAALWGMDETATSNYLRNRAKSSLRSLSLLEDDSEAGAGWYSQHPIIQAFAWFTGTKAKDRKRLLCWSKPSPFLPSFNRPMPRL